MEHVDRRDLLEVIGPLYRSLRRIEQRCAEAEQLTMWQYAILSVADRSQGLSQVELAERLGYSKNRIIGDLDALSARGLAERRPGADRRSYSIHTTSAGREIVVRVRERVWSGEDEALSHLSPEDRDLLRGLLQRAASTGRDG